MAIELVKSNASSFQEFTGMHYIKMDIAKQFSSELDRATFESRLKWFEDNKHQLHSLVTEADEPPLYMASVLCYEEVMRGEATGHLIGFDSCSSGPQLASAALACIAGCTATGLVDPTQRMDAYSQVTTETGKILELNNIDADRLKFITRKTIKNAAMPKFYGSRKAPADVFGEDTAELFAFNDAMYKVFPEAVKATDYLIDMWNPTKLENRWVMPDGHTCSVKVLEKIHQKLEVQELGGASMTHIIELNQTLDKSPSLAANSVQSIDAMVAREMVRRANYSQTKALNLLDAVSKELGNREPEAITDRTFLGTNVVMNLRPYMLKGISTQGLRRIHTRLEQMTSYQPFDVLAVHDDFKCSPKHMNRLRKNYNEIVAEICEGNVLEGIIQQIQGNPNFRIRRNQDDVEYLAQTIRNANYSLS